MPESSAQSPSGDSWLQDVFKQELSLDLTQLRSTGAAGEKVGEQIRQVLQQKVKKTVDPETGDVTYEYTPAAAFLVTPGEGWRDATMTALESRGKLLIGDALAALDRIVPLVQNAGAGTVEALRNTIGETLRALSNELGGEQLEPVLEELFERLLGKDQPPADGADKSLIGRLQTEAGLEEANVISPEDEEVLTAFYTIKENLGCLRKSWDERQQTVHGTGYQIARLATALTCGRETVYRIEGALEDASFSKACLDLLSFELEGEEEGEGVERTFGDVLGLAERGFASALETIRDSGRVGLDAVGTLIANIQNEVGYLLQALREEAGRRTAAGVGSCGDDSELHGRWELLRRLVDTLHGFLCDLHAATGEETKSSARAKSTLTAKQVKELAAKLKGIAPKDLEAIEELIPGGIRRRQVTGRGAQQPDERDEPELPFTNQVLEELEALVGRLSKQLDTCTGLLAVPENSAETSQTRAQKGGK